MRKAVKDFEGLYEVSDSGEVYSLSREVTGIDGKIYPFPGKKKSKNANPQTQYFTVQLYKHNRYWRGYIHRIVAQAFIPNPLNKPEINHKDGDRQNNNVANLEWVTSSENSYHAVQTGLRTYTNRLTEGEFLECLQDIIAGESYQKLSLRVPYKVPFLSTKIRKIAKKYNIEYLLDESLHKQKQERARINGAKNKG